MKKKETKINRKISNKKKPLAQHEVSLFALHIILLIVLSSGFLIVLWKYFTLKIEYKELIRQTSRVIVNKSDY